MSEGKITVDGFLFEYWKCRKCGLMVVADDWSRARPERSVCLNNHEATQMDLKSTPMI